MKKDVLYKEDFEGLYLRKNNFNKKDANEFKAENLEKYRKIVRLVANKNYHTYNQFLSRVGFEKEDLESIGLCYVYTFFQNTDVSQFKDPLHELKVLRRYLNQRYEQLIIFSKRKLKGITESSNYASIAIDSNDNFSARFMDNLCKSNDTPESLLIENIEKDELMDKFNESVDKIFTLFEKRNIYTSKLNVDQIKKVCAFYLIRYYKNGGAFYKSKMIPTKHKQRIVGKVAKLVKASEAKATKKVKATITEILELDFET